MQIWLNQLDGSTTVVNIPSDCTLEQFIELFNLGSARLVCQGSHLNASSFAHLADNSNVYVTGDLDGGKKKKKKKVFTNKKKNKHIHKRVKLAVYTLYSVDGIHSSIQVKAMSVNKERLVLHVDLEPLWLSIGTDIIVDSAIPQLRWMPKLLRKIKKL